MQHIKYTRGPHKDAHAHTPSIQSQACDKTEAQQMMLQARALAEHSPLTDPLHDRFQLAARYMEGAPSL